MQEKLSKVEKGDSKMNIDFSPTNDEETNHLKNLHELLGTKRKGDWLLVGEICGISSKNAEVAFSRVYSKYHNVVVEALGRVIENRKQMLSK